MIGALNVFEIYKPLLCCTVKHFSLYYILISREEPEISSDTKQARLDFMQNMLHNLNASFVQQDM